MAMDRFSIVFVNILFHIASFLTHFTLIKGQDNPPYSYISKNNFTHTDAKLHCDMVGPEKVVNLTSTASPGQLVWIDASIEYTRWAEYDRAYIFNNSRDLEIKEINTEDIFRWCIKYCKSKFFGLKNNKCACIGFDPETTGSKYIKSIGIREACSSGVAICGSGPDLSFAVYKPVNIPLHAAGDCITFRKSTPQNQFRVIQCNHEFRMLYRVNKNVYTEQLKNHWTATALRTSGRHGAVSYSFLNTTGVTINGLSTGEEAWLGNIRSYEIKSPSEIGATYCMAGVVLSQGSVIQSFRPCAEKLPVLCKVSKQMSPDTKDDFQLGNIIVGVLASVLAVVVVIVGVLLNRYIRNKRKVKAFKESAAVTVQSTQQSHNDVYAEVDKSENKSSQDQFKVAAAKSKTSTSHGQNQDVVYSMVNKPSKGVRKQEQPFNNATDQSASSSDIYDHTHQAPKKQFADENNYDTMKNLLGDDENVYNTSNEKEESRVIIVDNDNEYSHAQFNDENDKN